MRGGKKAGATEVGFRKRGREGDAVREGGGVSVD